MTRTQKLKDFVKSYTIPIVLGAGLAVGAYWGYRAVVESTPRDSVSKTKDKELEGKVYTLIGDEYFLRENRTAISLEEMKKRSVRKLEKAKNLREKASKELCSSKVSEINTKYDSMITNSVNEANRVWGIESPKPKEEPHTVRTNLLETILGLEREYDSIIESDESKKIESTPKEKPRQKVEPVQGKESRLVKTNLYEVIFGIEREYDSTITQSGGKN